MDLFTREHLHELLGFNGLPAISIYFPTHRKPPESLQDAIRFKNTLNDARDQLEQQGMPADEIETIIGPVRQLSDDQSFWQHQADGLAIFLSRDFHRVLRLPRVFAEQVHVRENFYVNPLLPLLQSNGTFYLLAVSQNSCRLFSGDRDSIHQIENDSLPLNLRDTMETWQKMQLNLRSIQQSMQTRGGANMSVFHGQFEDNTKEQLQVYFRKIDDAVAEILKSSAAPLVFAGVEYLFPIYQQANQYPGLCEQSITGSPDQLSGKELHDRAWEIVLPLFQQREKTLVDQYQIRLPRQTAARELAHVLSAAEAGLIETLMIREGAHVWGWFEPDSRVVTLAEGDSPSAEELVDRAVRLTIKAAGEVVSLARNAFPDNTDMIALLRAPVSTVAPVT